MLRTCNLLSDILLSSLIIKVWQHVLHLRIHCGQETLVTYRSTSYWCKTPILITWFLVLFYFPFDTNKMQQTATTILLSHFVNEKLENVFSTCTCPRLEDKLDFFALSACSKQSHSHDMLPWHRQKKTAFSINLPLSRQSPSTTQQVWRSSLPVQTKFERFCKGNDPIAKSRIVLDVFKEKPLNNVFFKGVDTSISHIPHDYWSTNVRVDSNNKALCVDSLLAVYNSYLNRTMNANGGNLQAL